MTVAIQNPKNEDAFKSIGRFVTMASTFEFFLNHMVECLSDDDFLIDWVHRQDFQSRVAFVKHHVQIMGKINALTPAVQQKAQNQSIEQLLEGLDNFCGYYLEKIKPCRDLVAHSPYLSGESGKIVSSRRYKVKSGKNSLKLDNLIELNEEAGSKLKDFLKLENEVIFYCSLIGRRSAIIKDLT